MSVCVAREVHKCNAGDCHQTRPEVRAIVAAVLSDSWPYIGILDMEIQEEDVCHTAPTTAIGDTVVLVKALWDKSPDPHFDIRAVMHAFVVSDDLLRVRHTREKHEK